MIHRNFQYIETNGVRLRTVVEGAGPLVIMVHGWPQCWYLWRHMIDPVVAAGYRVAVPDMRGFGASSCPSEISAYGIRNLSADLAGIATALGEEHFILVGHDWGCIVTWHSALLYPQRCTAVLGLSVPFWRMGPETVNPPGHDDDFWYMRYFQEPGVAEAELGADPRRTLLSVHYAVSGKNAQQKFFAQFDFPRNARLLDVFPMPAQLPDFMTQEDLDYYVEQYQLSGFHGSTNYYRNVPNLRTDTPELEGKKITQAAAFICGSCDVTLNFEPDWRANFENSFDDLRFMEFIDDVGHWVQLENPESTARQILRFLRSVKENPGRSARLA